MTFLTNQKVSVTGRFWYILLVVALRSYFEPIVQAVNKKTNVLADSRGGIAGFLLYAIVVIVLIIILILVLKFLFNLF
jgi:hypothetical protein